ncbi:RT0821/Lpp0805 family surface protein [Ferrovibrio sp. MS7]|jgi:surface antigen|uniref:RT0821/Lpp0805 family surface protein n=1 Tax=Ferrovibrio TaxID=1231242 RepID=UPI001B598654|nr:glycine zipper 2TM domain-containing protein [Ferrovibrio sp.]
MTAHTTLPAIAVAQPGRPALRAGGRAGKWVALGLVAVLAAGCADQGPKQNAGAVLGGVGGAVAGAQFGKGTGRLVGVAAGTMLGALLGSEVGKSLDNADRQYLGQANQRAFETARSGTAVTWRNPDSGNYGTVVPQPAYQTASGDYCREFQQTISVGGQSQQGYGTACRQPDGTWKITQ